MSVVAEIDEFFAPASFDALDQLLVERNHLKAHIETIAGFMTGKEMQSGFHYFAQGTRKLYDRFVPEASRIFDEEAAIKALDADFWQRALNLTNVYDFMPHNRRTDWNELIYDMKTPAFEDSRVRSTLSSLLAQRMDFLAEKVDTFFQKLSRTHATNQPQGFCKRSIVASAFDPETGLLGTNGGYIHDLRGVVGQFMGRDEPYWGSTRDVMVYARRTPGKWVAVDGGALRIRAYKKGTCHIEVHEDIAFRLNQILAHLYPEAIPHQNRERPKDQRKAKQVELSARTIPFNVLFHLSEGDFHAHANRIYGSNTFALGASFLSKDGQIKKAVGEVLETIGGVPGKAGICYTFDYDAGPVIEEIQAYGEIPDRYSHQYYPTPDLIAEAAIDLAEIRPEDRCLEPSAGQGHIAQHLPCEQTTCVEVSALHASILEAKGYPTIKADFLTMTAGQLGSPEGFDVIVMNPPYSKGRAEAHVRHAISMLAPGGRLVGVVPSGVENRWDLQGRSDDEMEWGSSYSNAFRHTGVNVQLFRYRKAGHVAHAKQTKAA